MIITNGKRVILRELELTDAPFIRRLLNEPGWLKYIGDRAVYNDVAAVEYILEGPQKSYAENGFGLYLVQNRADGSPLGLCGLMQREFLEHPDLGFAFLETSQRQGYAYEASTCVLNWSLNRGFGQLYAITRPDNHASRQLLKKLGFLTTRSFMLEEEELLLLELNLDKA